MNDKKEIDFETISHRIREVRISKGLTQEYLANEACVNPSHISNIENGKVKISLSTLINICNAMEVTVDYILSGEYIHPETSLEQSILLELGKCSDEMKERILKIILALQ
ncbi:MAG: helix-turn-helix domain-containing protein [Ruminococcus sp.]